MKCFVDMEFAIEEFRKDKYVVERKLILAIEGKMRGNDGWNEVIHQEKEEQT